MGGSVDPSSDGARPLCAVERCNAIDVRHVSGQARYVSFRRGNECLGHSRLEPIVRLAALVRSIERQIGPELFVCSPSGARQASGSRTDGLLMNTPRSADGEDRPSHPSYKEVRSQSAYSQMFPVVKPLETRSRSVPTKAVNIDPDGCNREAFRY